MAANTAHVVCLFTLLVLVSVSFADNDDHGSDAVSYDKDTFQSAISDKKHFVMFFAPWCGHCKRLAPTWNELAKVYNNDDSSVTVAKVDCTMETALCSDHDVTGYPTLKFFHQKANDFQRYKGNRDLDSLKKFVEEQASRTESEGDQPPPPEDEKTQALTELTDATFDAFIKEGFHFVKFYAPWCGHCKRLAPTWEELAKSFADNKQVSISKVDCTLSTKLCTNQGVRGYPTLILFNNGDKLEQYQGSRSHEDLKSFVTKKVGETSGSQQEAVPEEQQQQQVEVEEAVVELTDETFDDTISQGLTFVKFFAPWCGHCKRLAPTWEELGAANEEKDVTIARVDCTKYKSVCDGQSVRGYPTLAIFRNGERVNDYKGQRDLESLQEFVDNFLEHIEL